MRFVLAILSFVIAAGMIGYGVAQHTILAQPPDVSLAVQPAASAVTVIDGATLNAFDGSQSLRIIGDGKVFAAYGRTPDVMAWIGDTKYTKVGYDAKTQALTSTQMPGKESAVPNPTGADIWLNEYNQDRSMLVTVNVPADVSFVIMSDGTKPAPANITVTWPLDNSTPWAGPLILGGAIVLIGGLGLLLWATNHMRSGRGPRRKPQKMPKVPRKRILPARRSIRQSRARVAAPLVLIGALALSGCSVGGPGSSIATPTPTSTSTGSPASPVDPPAVTETQVKRIISKISEVTTKADATKDSALLATRFSGAALELRQANYAIRGADPAVAALAAIPDGPVKLTLPQQTSGWPRSVFVVIQNDADATVPPIALFLEQADARAAYKVSYAMTLEPSAQLPDVAPANVGAARLAPESGLLKLAPKDAALAYGDILEKDTASTSYLDFEAKGDSLRTAVGLAKKQEIKAALPATASVTFGHGIGAASAIAFATNDAGAIVAVNLNETTTVKPVEAGAAVNPTGSVKALSGISVSTKGVVATYGDQLLFYIPPAGSSNKIILLGYSQGLVAAKEL